MIPKSDAHSSKRLEAHGGPGGRGRGAWDEVGWDGMKQPPRQIFEKLLNKNAIKVKPKIGAPWQFCAESLDPPGPPPPGILPKI